MSKEEYVKYIHELTTASSVKLVCEDLGITRTNISSGATTEANLAAVAEELTKRVQEVLKKYGK